MDEVEEKALDIYLKYLSKDAKEGAILIKFTPENIFKFKEEFLDESNRFSESVLHKTATNAEFYILTDGFNELRKSVNVIAFKDFYPETSGFDYDNAHAFQKYWDYKLAPLDNMVYNFIDCASLALGVWGLDIVPDILGLGYSIFRGDYLQTTAYSINVLIVGSEGQFITRFSRQIKPKQVVRRTNDNVEIFDYSDDVIRATKKTINDDKVAAWIKHSNNSKTDLAGYLNDPKHIDFKNKVNQLDNPDAFCETMRKWKRDKIHSFQLNNGFDFWEELYKVNPNLEWLSDFNIITCWRN